MRILLVPSERGSASPSSVPEQTFAFRPEAVARQGRPVCRQKQSYRTGKASNRATLVSGNKMYVSECGACPAHPTRRGSSRTCLYFGRHITLGAINAAATRRQAREESSMSIADPVVIVAAARTPLGRLQGDLSALHGHELGSHVIRAVVERSRVDPADLSEVLMGCVLPAGQGQAPARQAARGAGLPDLVGATTINKVCGSGMKAAMFAYDLIVANSSNVIIAGGMESMSNAPYMLAKARSGYKSGHDRLFDHMMLDGLEDAYESGRPMGDFGEAAVEAFHFSRSDQDTYATSSLQRARAAIQNGAFAAEIVPIEVPAKGGSRLVDTDEHPLKVSPEKIPQLKPAFRVNGTITAASASANADGAAALVLMRRSEAARRGSPVLAEVVGHATHSQNPAWYTTAPAPSIRKLLERVGWTTDDVDLYEINEAFAAVAMAAVAELKIPNEKLNVNGGACALGHPIGATGARLIVTLLHALEARSVRRGVASLCIGGGEATSIAIERPEA